MVRGRCVDNRVFLDYSAIVRRVEIDVGVSIVCVEPSECRPTFVDAFATRIDTMKPERYFSFN